jgi:hypothetical protein
MSAAPWTRAVAASATAAKGRPGAARTTHIEHAAQMAPVTMGTKHDRMQYEMPSMPSHADHEAHHTEAASHAGMDHDM